MNERIVELAEQATTKISFRIDPTTYKHIDGPRGGLVRFEFDKEKFAELILEEVRDIIADVYREYPLDKAAPFLYLDEQIVEHFYCTPRKLENERKD